MSLQVNSAALLPLLLAAAFGSAAPQVQVELEGGVYAIRGSFEVAADPRTAWAVVSDYDHIDRFVSSIRRSMVRERSGTRVQVEQEGVGKVFLFSRRIRVLLQVEEKPGQSLSFREVSGQDFEVYAGTWRIRRYGAGSMISYELRAKPRAALPGFVGRSAFKNDVAELLTEVRSEIERRHPH